MSAKNAIPGRISNPLAFPRINLPDRLADFGVRGFRTEPAARRAVLEGHARHFLTGFNLAAAHWPAVHEALAELPADERGFGYEGAALYAALRDLAGLRGRRSLARLMSGQGTDYIHLCHTGYGWLWAPLRLPLPVALPETPLLRWLAVDGAGFGETFFGGDRAFDRRVRQRPTPVWRVRVAGCGRALWLLLCAEPSAIAARIAGAPAEARGWLWSGVGLAAGYAGSVTADDLDRLAEASGVHRPHLAQGVVFAVTARARAGTPPEHTELACRTILSTDCEHAARWADTAADGLSSDPRAEAYLEWKRRIRELAASP